MDMIWAEIPTGYFPLPIDDIEASMARAEEVLIELAPDELRPAVAPVVSTLTVLLEQLAARDTVYCGVGRHLSAVDGSVITSSLVLAHRDVGEKRNPRLVLADLVKLKAEAGERGQVDLVDVAGRPMFFFERTQKLPTPRMPGAPPVPEDSVSPVFQIEAVVPSEDGSELVAIDFSTPMESHGPEFRAMMVQLAASVSFEPPVPESVGQRLDG
jgi:hypothetical protein